MDQPNQKSITEVQEQNTSISKLDAAVLFSGDSYGLFVFNKTEQIVTAIYLLTGLMSDKEPMKEKVRGLANSMLGNALAMSERVWGEDICQKNLLSAIYEASVLFDIAERAKMMSKMNHDILAVEFQKLSNFLITSSSNYSSAKIAFPENLFEGGYNYVPEKTYQPKPNISDSQPLPHSDEFSKGQYHIKDIQKDRKIDTVLPKEVQENKKDIKGKTNRQGVILHMLKDGSKLTIKDFAKNIKNCSDKTIQRELLLLVSQGVLKKEGERRWSRYFLA